jgi:hypothetical protein
MANRLWGDLCRTLSAHPANSARDIGIKSHYEIASFSIAGGEPARVKLFLYLAFSTHRTRPRATRPPSLIFLSVERFVMARERAMTKTSLRAPVFPARSSIETNRTLVWLFP